MSEHMIAGKRVVLKDNVSVGDMRALRKALPDMDPKDISSMPPLCAVFVCSWEFAGDPSDPMSYDAMDVREFVPLIAVVTDRLNALSEELTAIQANAKN